MASATPEDQLLLLPLQAAEGRVRSLARLRRETADDEAVRVSEAAEGVAVEQLTVSQSARAEADAAVQALEDESGRVGARIAKDEAALVAGQAGAGTLQGLQREIESLTAKASELEDAELEALDVAEAAGVAVEAAKAGLSAARERLEAARQDLAARLAEIDTQAAEAAAARTAAAAAVSSELLAIFESTLAKRGVGAARLFHGTSEGSGMALSPGDLADIKRQPENSVVFCPDSGVILVRSAEWA